MLMAVLWMTASSAWADCTINWVVQASENQGDGTYRRELTADEYAACDPEALDGIYSTSYATDPSNTVNAIGAVLAVDLSMPAKDLLVLRPSQGYTGPWSFRFYGCPTNAPYCGYYTSVVTINVTLAPPPTVTAISPTAGPLAGGTSVRITGTNFTGATKVTFGGKPVPNFTINSATQITAVTPSGGAAGTVDAVVSNPFYSTATSAADQFTYVVAPVANAASATVAHGSSANAVALNITGGAPTSVAVSTAASHGTATASGTSITYTPNASYSGTDTFAYTATNVAGTSAPATVTVTVSNGTVTYAPASPPNGLGNAAYNQSLASATGGTAPYTYAVTSGALPAGLTLSTDGTLSGTPTAAGTFNFAVTATDSSTGTGPFSATSGPLSMVVTAPAITLSPTSLGGGSVGTAYSQMVAASGGVAPYTYAVSNGALPAGLTLSSAGVLSGTPTAGGSFNFSVVATDANGFTGSRAYTLTVNTPTLSLSPAPGTLVSIAGVPYSQTFTPGGGTAPYTYAVSVSAGTLPAGVSLNTSTGVLSGTPTSTGSATFTVTATDSSSGTGPYSTSATYTLLTAAPLISMSPATLPGATVGTAYSQNVAASGGTAPYTYAVTSGTLPTGLTLSSTGALSGTPTAGGTFNFTIGATDSTTGTGPFTSTRAYSVSVALPTLTLTPSSGTALSATGGVSFSQTFTAGGGTGPYTYAFTVNSGALPTGLSFNAATHTLSGTPTKAGTVSFTITATDSSSGSGPYNVVGTYTLTVNAPTLTVAPATLPNPAIGSAYSQPLTSTNGTAPYGFVISNGQLPNGLSLSSAGTLSGTPTAVGTFNFTVQATDAYGFTASRAYTLTLGAPTLSLTPASGALNGAIGVALNQPFLAAGGTTPYTYALAINSGALPAGMTFNMATGVLSGTPTAAGTASFTVTATDSSSGGTFNATGTYTLTVVAPTVTISPATLPNAAVGAAYSQTATATGGASPYTYTLTAGALPAGLTLNSSTGAITGTPTAAGTFNLTLRAADANGYSGMRSYSLVVPAPTVGLNPATLPSAGVGVAYSQNVAASGGTAPYTYAITTGSLPAGLALSSTGVLSGTPTAGGTFSFTIGATDSTTGTGPVTGSRVYTLNVGTPTLTLTPSPATALSAVAGTSFNQTFSASGGVSPYTYVFTIVSGTMPSGLSFNAATHTLSGTPTTAGTVSFNITATDSSGGSGPYTVPGTYTLTVSAPTLTVGPAALPAPVIGVPYSQTLTATSGAAPYTFAITSGTLPTGLSLSSAGVLSGTPTAGGGFNFTVVATDANGFTASRTYGIAIAAANVVINPATVPNATLGTAYSQTLAAGGGMGPYTYAVTSGTLPAGISLNGSTGVLSGTPTALGSSTFTVRATDSSTGTGAPYSGTRGYTLVVAQAIGTAPAITATTNSSTPITLHPTANATGGPFSAVTIVSPPTSGTAVVNGMDIVYTPTPNTSGNVGFTYALVNTAGTSAPIQVTVTVKAVPIAPAQKQATTLAGQGMSVDLTDGATGGPFTGAAVVSVVPANAGTATIVQKTASPSGVQIAAVAAPTYLLNFVPPSTFTGTAVVTYTLSNSFATSAPAVVQVSVAPRRDPSTDPDVSGLINAQVQAAQRFANTQISNYNQRLEALHGTGRAPSRNGLTVALPSPNRVDAQTRCQDVFGIAAHDACLRGDHADSKLPAARGRRSADARDASARKDGDDAGPDLPGAAAGANSADNGDPNLAFWSAGTLDFGFANAGTQRSGFRFTTGGVTAGADYRMSDQVSVGAGFGYGRDSTDIGSVGTKSTGDSYSLALYGSFRPLPSLFVDGVAGFGTLSFDSRRWVTDASDFATGKRNGRQMFASVSAGYEHRDRTWLVSPYGRLAVSQSTLDQFSESGAGINALTYFAQTVTSVSGTLGLRTEYLQKTKWGTFLPYARVEYQHDFNGQGGAGLAYADHAAFGPAYTVTGSPYSRDRMQIGLGTKFRTGALTFGLDYSVMTGMGGLQQGLRLTFAAPF